MMLAIKKIPIRAILTITLGICLPLCTAMAQEITWQTLRVQGEGKAAVCDQNTVLTSYAGQSASFVFTNLSVNLSANAPHQSGAEFGACRVRSRFVIPQGYYLAGLSQSTVAGVVMSIGARGEIRSSLSLQGSENSGNRDGNRDGSRDGGREGGGNRDGNGGGALPGLGNGGRIIENRVRFAPTDEMNQPMLILDGSYSTAPAAVRYMCQYSKTRPIAMDMEFRASVMGQRRNATGPVIISIDSSDVQLRFGARLGRCP